MKLTIRTLQQSVDTDGRDAFSKDTDDAVFQQMRQEQPSLDTHVANLEHSIVGGKLHYHGSLSESVSCIGVYWQRQYIV